MSSSKKPSSRYTTNRYNVSGTFSYLSYCDDCEPCEGHEKLHTVKNLDALGDNEKEAGEDAIETLRLTLDYHEACWLHGQPEIEFVAKVQIGAPDDLPSYWTMSREEQEKIKSKL